MNMDETLFSPDRHMVCPGSCRLDIPSDRLRTNNSRWLSDHRAPFEKCGQLPRLQQDDVCVLERMDHFYLSVASLGAAN